MNIWLISDTHFGHENILKFTWRQNDGDADVRIRPEFDTVAEMNEAMIARWNAVVKHGDHVYHLGDVALKMPSTEAAAIVARLNGVKRLVRGNHDSYTTSQYVRMGFTEIYGMKLLAGCWLTHMPMHPDCMGKALGNVHGHIHQNPSPAGQYLNVSVEVVNYTPVSLEDAQAQLSARSSEVERAAWAREAGGSNPPALTTTEGVIGR